MSKTQLMAKAQELDCLVHASWSVGEVRQVALDKIKGLQGVDNIPKRLASTLPQPKETCQEINLEVPVSDKGATSSGTAQTVRARRFAHSAGTAASSFGRFRTPTSSGAASRRPSNASIDFILANMPYATMKFQAKPMYDPEVNCKVPHRPDEEDRRRRSGP